MKRDIYVSATTEDEIVKILDYVHVASGCKTTIWLPYNEVDLKSHFAKGMPVFVNLSTGTYTKRNTSHQHCTYDSRSFNILTTVKREDLKRGDALICKANSGHTKYGIVKGQRYTVSSINNPWIRVEEVNDGFDQICFYKALPEEKDKIAVRVKAQDQVEEVIDFVTKGEPELVYTSIGSTANPLRDYPDNACIALDTAYYSSDTYYSKDHTVISFEDFRRDYNPIKEGDWVVYTGKTIGAQFTEGKLYQVRTVSDRYENIGVVRDDRESLTNGHNLAFFRKARIKEVNNMAVGDLILGSDTISMGTISITPPKEVDYYALIKEYPGSPAIGTKSTNYTYATWPKYWQPVYKPTEFTVKCDSGNFQVEIKNGSAWHEGKEYIPLLLEQITRNSIDTMTCGGYDVKMSKIDIGCKKGVSVDSLRELRKILTLHGK